MPIDDQDLIDKLSGQYEDVTPPDDASPDAADVDDAPVVDDGKVYDKDDLKDSAAKFTLEDVERISGEASKKAVAETMAAVRNTSTRADEPDVDALLGDIHEVDKAVAKKAISIAVDQAVNQLRAEFAPMLSATRGSVIVQEVSRHMDIEADLVPYIEDASREFGLQAGTLDAKQAKAVVTLARGLRSEVPKEKRVIARTSSVQTDATARVPEYEAIPEDKSFDAVFGKEMAKSIRKSRGEF